MNNQYTRRGNTQKNAHVSNNAVMRNSFQHLHLNFLLHKEDEILNQVQDDNSIKEEALNKDSFRAPLRSGFTRPSSSRNVSMRDIGAVPALYPALQACGMTERRSRGFTLIELLVVVLIIGILAAIAVPQYQFAVDKARITPYLTHIKSIVSAEQIYHLANGEYTGTLAALDIDLTKICPNMRGSNELVNCPGNLSITAMMDLSVIPPVPVGIYLDFCPTFPCNYRSTNKIIHSRFSMKTGEIISCTSDGTDRGQKLCKWLNPE